MNRKTLFTFTLCSLFCLPLLAFTPELKTFTLNDGETVEGRVCLPDDPVETLVFCIHGTGPSTYLTKRPNFNYYDLIAEGFCEQNVAFFTYNRRGVTDGETPPLFVEVDTIRYKKYTPLQEAMDVESMIKELQQDDRFSNCKILLYGISEGTIIAPLVAERKIAGVDGLILHGYAHENMNDILKWQMEGHGLMRMVQSIFDKDEDQKISREEYEDEDQTITAYRNYLFQGLPFDSVDRVKDNIIDIQDIREMRWPFYLTLMEKIENNDYNWIRSNFMDLTPEWFHAHFKLEPNKTRLLQIDIPIYIFHGVEDANVPVATVYELEKSFKEANKNNLYVYTFDNHNHDLNFQEYLVSKEWPEGYQKLFECVRNF